MKRNQIIASSLGALAITGLAVYLIKRRKRSRNVEESEYLTYPSQSRNRSRISSKSKALLYEPDDHPE